MFLNIFFIRARPRKITSPTGSKDLQTVNISLRVLSRPSSPYLPVLHMALGPDYEEKVSLLTFIVSTLFFFFFPLSPLLLL